MKRCDNCGLFARDKGCVNCDNVEKVSRVSVDMEFVDFVFPGRELHVGTRVTKRDEHVTIEHPGLVRRTYTRRKGSKQSVPIPGECEVRVT